MTKTLVLGSSSPSRKDLLAKLLLPFTCDAADIDETPYPQETAEQLVERLAIAKAQTVAARHPQALIIGSDSVAEFQGAIMGKPLTHEKAVKYLRQVSGGIVTFHTGLCLWDSASGHYEVCVEKYLVKFTELSDAMIENYLCKEQPYQCAGGVKAETIGIALFDYLRGDDFNSLIGLPLIKLSKMLRQFGMPVV